MRLSSALLGGMDVDVVVAQRQVTATEPIALIGLFPSASNAGAIAAQRRATLADVDLVRPDATRSGPAAEEAYPFGLLIPTSVLERLTEEARASVRKDPHYDILDISLALRQPATLVVEPSIYGQLDPGVPLFPGITEFTASPRISIELAVQNGRVVAEGQVELRSIQLEIADLAMAQRVTQGLQRVIQDIQARLAGVPRQYLIPQGDGLKLLIDVAEVACVATRAPGPDHEGSVPAGMHITGDLVVAQRKPAVHVVGPSIVRAKPDLGAHGCFRAVPVDLREPAARWSSDGTVSTPDCLGTTVGWSTKGAAVGSRTHHTVTLRVQGADGVVQEASQQVTVVVEPMVRLPGKPRADPGLDVGRLAGH